MRKLMSAFIGSNQVCHTEEEESSFMSNFEEDINNTLSNLSQGDINHNKCLYLTTASTRKLASIEKQTADLLASSHQLTTQENALSLCSLASDVESKSAEDIFTPGKDCMKSQTHTTLN